MTSLRTLYDIREDLLRLLDEVDPETGEYLAGAEAIISLQIERNEKRRGIALYIKSLKAFRDSIKKARDALNAKLKRVEERIEFLTDLLMQDLDGEKMKEPEFSIYYHTTRNIVEIAEGTELPDEFVKVERIPKKTELKEALLDGEIIEGVTLRDKVSMVIR